MNCVSASGKYLGRAPSEKVLAEFAKLPEAERKPGAVRVPDVPVDQLVIPTPPKDGLVLKVHARFLTYTEDGELRYARGEDFPTLRENPGRMRTWQLFLQPNTEFLWLTKADRQSLIPKSPAVGQKIPVNPVISERMARFHMYPRRSTTSEGLGLSQRAIRKADLTLTVTEVSPTFLRMKLSGFVHIGSEYDEQKATSPNGPLSFGFASKMFGLLEYDRKKKTITRFDMVAPGHVWGRWGDANNRSMPIERSGRTPFGYAFELADSSVPANCIPPGGNAAMVTGKRGYFPQPK